MSEPLASRRQVIGALLAAGVSTLTAGAVAKTLAPGAAAIVRDLDDRNLVKWTLRGLGCRPSVDASGFDNFELLRRALVAGVPLEGEGLAYGYDGELAISGVKGLTVSNATLKAYSPTFTRSGVTLWTLNNCDDISFDNVSILLDGSVASVIDAGGRDADYLNHNTGLRINGGTGHRLRRMSVRGTGVGSGIMLNKASDFRIDNFASPGVKRNVVGGRDDIFQALHVNGCTDFTIAGAELHNLLNVHDRMVTPRFSRGIALGGCKRFRITKVNASFVDQAIDITGGPDSNEDGQVSQVFGSDITSVLAKVANSGLRIAISDVQGRFVGRAVVIVSGSHVIGLPVVTQQIQVRRVSGYNAGAAHHDPASPTVTQKEFAGPFDRSVVLVERQSNNRDYPKDVTIDDVIGTDDQVEHTMQYVVAVNTDKEPGQEPVRATNVRGSGYTRALTVGLS